MMILRTRGWSLYVGFAFLAILSSHAWCQTVTYTHTSATDGFSWPSGLDVGFSYPTPDGVEYYNETGSYTYFDEFYSVVGDSGHITGDAWWGTPDGGVAYLNFYDTPAGGVDTLSFDFAWASDDEYVPDYLYFDIYDSDYNETYLEVPLSNYFTSGDYEGYAGHVSINAADLLDENYEEPVQLIDLYEVAIYVGDIYNENLTAEFAIDNVTINGSGGDPEDSDLSTSLASSTRYLRGSFDPQIRVNVANNGSGATTFSQSLDPGTDPLFQVLGPISGEPIAAGGQVFPPAVTKLDKDDPSGEYVAQVRTTNDLNPADPDSITPYTVRLYDAPELTDNSGAPIDLNSVPTLTISNAAAGPHAGALRAGAEVTARTVTGEGFDVVGMDVGAFVEAGENELAVGTFNRFGQLSGTHAGAFSVDLEMNSAAGSFLNGSQPLPSVNWDLEFTLGDTPSDSATLALGESMDDKLGVNSSTTAVTIVDGLAGSAQTITMDFAASPGPGQTTVPLLATALVEVDFATPGDQYVLQFTYTDPNVPGSLSEGDLELIYYNEIGDEWQAAVTANSDGGLGETMFSGSFDDYLASLSGSPVELGTYGVDTVGNHAWAVLDHASLFGLGAVVVGDPLPGDFNGDGSVDAADYALWRNHRGDLNENALNGAGDGLSGVDDGDYALWREHYGSNLAPLAQAPVPAPEPTAMLLAMLGLAAVALRRS